MNSKAVMTQNGDILVFEFGLWIAEKIPLEKPLARRGFCQLSISLFMKL